MIPKDLIVKVKQFDLTSRLNVNGVITDFEATETKIFVEEFVARPEAKIKNEILSIRLAERGPKGEIDGIPTLIQDIQPDLRQPYYWIQTNIDGDPNKFAQWFYDGVD